MLIAHKELMVVGGVIAFGLVLGATLAGAAPGRPSNPRVTHNTYSHEDTPPPAPTPRFGPDSPDSSSAPPTYGDGIANLRYDAAYLAFVLARIAGDENVCGSGCPLPPTPENLRWWLQRACDRAGLAAGFVRESGVTPTAMDASLLDAIAAVCEEAGTRLDVSGDPSPDDGQWRDFAKASLETLSVVTIESDN